MDRLGLVGRASGTVYGATDLTINGKNRKGKANREPV